MIGSVGLLAAAIAIGLGALGAGLGQVWLYHVHKKESHVNQKHAVFFKQTCSLV